MSRLALLPLILCAATGCNHLFDRMDCTNEHLCNIEQELMLANEKLEEANKQLKTANAKRWRGFEAPYANLACVEAATRLPFEEGLAFEREQFMKLMFGSLIGGLPLMLLFENPFTRIAGVILCFTFIISGVFVLAHPSYLGRDEE